MFIGATHGTLSQYDHPDWEPLIALVGVELVEWFMWMHEIELEDGERVHAYKHIATRRYFHLGENGGAYVFQPESHYRPISSWRAIQDVFAGWESLLPAPDDVVAHAGLLRAAATRAMRRDERIVIDD